MYYDLTRGKISRSLILFALPMIAGNLLQQFYNIADTLIVGRVLGSNALAAVGSSYTLMTFLTSIFLGLSMGAGALFSIYQGRKDLSSLKTFDSPRVFADPCRYARAESRCLCRHRADPYVSSRPG